MTDATQEVLNAKDKVQVLLHEYDTLRTEIIHRTNHMYQLLGIGSAILAWLASRPVDARFWILLVLSLGAISLFSWFMHRDISKAAERLRQLEQDVNRRAGEELLVWERRWGGAVTGNLGRGRPRLAENTAKLSMSLRGTVRIKMLDGSEVEIQVKEITVEP